jgi:hypothetical protein
VRFLWLDVEWKKTRPTNGSSFWSDEHDRDLRSTVYKNRDESYR